MVAYSIFEKFDLLVFKEKVDHSLIIYVSTLKEIMQSQNYTLILVKKDKNEL